MTQIKSKKELLKCLDRCDKYLDKESEQRKKIDEFSKKAVPLLERLKDGFKFSEDYRLIFSQPFDDFVITNESEDLEKKFSSLLEFLNETVEKEEQKEKKRKDKEQKEKRGKEKEIEKVNNLKEQLDKNASSRDQVLKKHIKKKNLIFGIFFALFTAVSLVILILAVSEWNSTKKEEGILGLLGIADFIIGFLGFIIERASDYKNHKSIEKSNQEMDKITENICKNYIGNIEENYNTIIETINEYYNAEGNITIVQGDQHNTY